MVSNLSGLDLAQTLAHTAKREGPELKLRTTLPRCFVVPIPIVLICHRWLPTTITSHRRGRVRGTV